MGRENAIIIGVTAIFPQSTRKTRGIPVDLRGLAREWEWRLVNPTGNHGQPNPGLLRINQPAVFHNKWLGRTIIGVVTILVSQVTVTILGTVEL